MKYFNIRLFALVAVALLLAPRAEAKNPPGKGLSVTDYPSIQEAIDANPGKMMYVPPGDYEISKQIEIRHAGSGLYGYGRIIQTTPEEAVLWIEAENVRILDITVTRPDGKGGKRSAIFAPHSRNLVLDGVQVLNTRAPCGAINVDWSDASQIRNCLVENYRAIAIEDRTGRSPEGGYAYKSYDGTGIQTTNCVGVLVEGNRVFQTEYFATPEAGKQHDMGRFVKKDAKKGTLVSQKMWDEEYAPNWFQGTGITINGAETMDYVLVLGNFVLNAFQAFDIQGDHVILANNITNKSFLGMKAMHGSRNTLVLSNQFSNVDINGVLLQPGAMSHAAGERSYPDQKNDANVDGGSIVANNIVSNFGYGDTHWFWATDGRFPFEFSCGQLPDDPALRDVVVEGNISYDPGRDKALVDGKAVVQPPRAHAAVLLAAPQSGPNKGPVNVQFSGNIFHPGVHGVSVPDTVKP